MCGAAAIPCGASGRRTDSRSPCCGSAGSTRCRAAVENATTLSTEVGSLWEFGLVLAARAGLALLCGDLNAADEDADRALRLQALSGYGWTAALLLPALALAHLNRGDIEGATDLVSTWEADADDLSRTVYVALMRTVVDVRAGGPVARWSISCRGSRPSRCSARRIWPRSSSTSPVSSANPKSPRPALQLVEATIDRGMIVSNSLAIMLPRVAGDGHALVGDVEPARRRYAAGDSARRQCGRPQRGPRSPGSVSPDSRCITTARSRSRCCAVRCRFSNSSRCARRWPRRRRWPAGSVSTTVRRARRAGTRSRRRPRSCSSTSSTRPG